MIAQMDLFEIISGVSVYLPEVLIVIFAFVIESKLVKKIEDKSVTSKIAKAKELGQIVEGQLCSKGKMRTNNRRWITAKYKYVLDGKEGIVWERFRAMGTWYEFPETINVYFLDGKVYTNSSRDNFRGAWFVIVPFLIGGIVMYLRHPELTNF